MAYEQTVLGVDIQELCVMYITDFRARHPHNTRKIIPTGPQNHA